MAKDTTEHEVEPAGDEILSGHCYDGIEEYDNPTPGWWQGIFVATIVLTPIYLLWFHSPYQENTLADQYVRAQAANLRLQFGEIGTLTPDERTILKYMNDREWLPVGKTVFQTHCVSCHGEGGKGLTGPNLTDGYYKNVKEITDIPKVIQEGANNLAMPAWEGRLHPNELVLVASYVASLRGENVPGRAAEGNEIPPWPEAPAAGAEDADAAQ